MKHPSPSVQIVFVLAVFLFHPLVASAQLSGDKAIPDAADNIIYVQSTSIVDVHVMDSSGTPLNIAATIKLFPYLQVTIQGRNIYDATAKNGLAHIEAIDGGDYVLEVSAPGFQMHREKLTVLPGYAKTQAYVKMHPFDGSEDDITLEQPGAPVINPSIRRDVELAIAAMQAGKPDQAVSHVKTALKRAPDNPDVHFIAGYVAEGRKDNATARAEYEAAIKLFPNHLSAQLSLGDYLVRNNDSTGAIPHLEKALVVGPNSWRAHWLLAEADLQIKPPDFDASKLHANRAIELGKERANAALITLALGVAMAGDLHGGKTQLEEFLKDYPKDKSADRAKQAIVSIEHAEAIGAASGNIVAPMPATDIGDLEGISPEAMPGLPAGIDSAVPAVSSGVACELPQVLTGAAVRSREFADNLLRFSAKELVVHEDLDAKGTARKSANATYSYVADLERPAKNMIVMSELRNGSYGFGPDFPAPLAMDGIPAVGLIFNSAFGSDFTFSCEGLGQWHGQPAWQVRFQQRADRPARIHDWTIKGKTYPAILKGRAWITADSYQLVHIETDLTQPIPAIKLEYQHMSIDYAPVNFPSNKNALWLPASAQIYCKYRGRYFRQEHDYSNFTLYSVDTRETQGKPKSKSE
ncbi:MAG TPA: tetratricopeptide repeat protein [Candidatus Acidoferrales bacterium]|nr:tetratricopeptide repeat protein [Candidatus Acidoferrales bacterium]